MGGGGGVLRLQIDRCCISISCELSVDEHFLCSKSKQLENIYML